MSIANKIIKETQEKQDLETREKIWDYFSDGDEITISLIQRKCRAGYFSSSRVLTQLIKEGFVVGRIFKKV